MIYLNGAFMALDEARISPLDRGFLFGDGVYEVIPAYAGRLFRARQHLRRLQNSLDFIRLPNPHSPDEWLEILQKLMALQGFDNHIIYLQITRGADDHRDHAIPQGIAPTVFAMSTEMPGNTDAASHPGAAVITRPDSRWQHCDVKAITLLANILLRQQALDRQCAETFLLRDGYVVEGCAGNVFIVTDNTLVTPPTGPMLLPGVTRDLTLEIAREDGIACAERDIAVAELFGADEVMFTSSTKEVVPVVTVDDKPIGTGAPGPVWRRLIALYGRCKERLMAG